MGWLALATVVKTEKILDSIAVQTYSKYAF